MLRGSIMPYEMAIYMGVQARMYIQWAIAPGRRLNIILPIIYYLFTGI